MTRIRLPAASLTAAAAAAACGTEISKGSAPAVRTLAENALPVLQRHLARMRVAKGG